MFIELETDGGDKVIERIKNIESIQRLPMHGVRIWWKSSESDEGMDYLTSWDKLKKQLIDLKVLSGGVL